MADEDENTIILTLHSDKTKLELTLSHIAIILNDKWLTDEVTFLIYNNSYISLPFMSLIIFIDHQLLLTVY